MEKRYKALLIGLTVLMVSIISTPAFARSISFKDAGAALWIFVIIGAIIILLQLIPAAILFFTFIGTTTGLILKKKAPEKETALEKIGLPEYEPAAVKK